MVAVALLALAAPLIWAAVKAWMQSPLEVFLDRHATIDMRLHTIPRLPLDDEGAMARVLLGVREETDPKLVVPALAGLADRVDAGQVPPSGHASFVTLLQGLLADATLDADIHRAAFAALVQVGAPGEILAGVLGYLRADAAAPLDGQFLDYLRRSPKAAPAYRGDSPEAVRAREELAKLLPARPAPDRRATSRALATPDGGSPPAGGPRCRRGPVPGCQGRRSGRSPRFLPGANRPGGPPPGNPGRGRVATG